MSIVVTGATGHFGRLVVESLLERGVPAATITATGRDVAKIADLAAQGVQVARADYTDPASLVAAFAGAQKVLLISGSEVGQRATQHRAAIAAAKQAGVGFLVYTSILKADTSSLALAEEHLDTETYLAESGLDYAILRNGWYLENYTGQVATYLAVGVAGAASDGRVSAATRADLADAAAAVLNQGIASGTIVELGGAGFTLSQLAAELSSASGQDIGYVNLTEDAYADLLVQAGLPPAFAAVLADSDRGLSIGDLETDPAPLTELIGREPTTMREAIAAAVAAAA
jgi:NAD(P)H dehydrogenase (quinone)